MSEFITSQVNDTNPGPYDQVLMLSQSIINRSLKTNYEKQPADSKMRNVNYSVGGLGSIKGGLEAPEVQFRGDDLSPYFILKFQTGAAMYLRTSDDKEKRFELGGSVFAFPVKLSKSCPPFFVVITRATGISTHIQGRHAIESKILKQNDSTVKGYATKMGYSDKMFRLEELYLSAISMHSFTYSNARGATPCGPIC